MRSKTDISIFYKTKKERNIFTNRSKDVPGFTCFHADNKLTNSEFQNPLSAYLFPVLTRYYYKDVSQDWFDEVWPRETDASDEAHARAFFALSWKLLVLTSVSFNHSLLTSTM